MDCIFKQDAKAIVDMFFAMNLFKEHMTRDDMTDTEVFIRDTMQSRFDSHIKAQKLFNKLNKK